MPELLLQDIVFVTGLAAILSWVFVKFRQSPILAYLIVGFVLGPRLFNIIETQEVIEALARFGIAFLLFMVGLEFNVGRIKAVGKTALITGLGQIMFTTIVGYLIGLAVGLEFLEALYVAIALTFSSTIIIVKLLSEKKDLDSLHGRISIGFLLVQDVAAVVFLMAVGLTPNWGSGGIELAPFLLTIIGSLALVGFVALAALKVLPHIFSSIARSQEVLFLSSVAWCFAIAALAEVIGLSLEAGALIAGISLASLPFHAEISGKIRGLRDFFVILFFVMLGMQLALSLTDIVIVIILSLFVLIGNPLIVMSIMGLLGYHRRTSFFAGLTVAQISEFSLIIANLGLANGHLSKTTAGIITSVGVITISASTYFITYNQHLYRLLDPWLRVFQRRGVVHEARLPDTSPKDHVVLFGFHRMGTLIANALKKNGTPLVVVDFNPTIIDRLKRHGFNYMYGDYTDPEIYERLNLSKARLIISTVIGFEENLQFLSATGFLGVPRIVTAHDAHDALGLYKAGADYVIMPHYLGGQHAARLLKKIIKEPGAFAQEKKSALRELKSRLAEDSL